VILKREKNWEKISKDIQGKTPSQCKNRWKSALSPSIVKVTERRKWVPEEDEKLSKLVKKYGTKNWRIIASHLRGRLPKQCRERWINHLDPTIVKGRLTEKEWKMVLDAHEELGNRWSEIAKLLPGRTPNQIKNHWHAMVRKTNKRKFKDYYEDQDESSYPESMERVTSPRRDDSKEGECSSSQMEIDSVERVSSPTLSSPRVTSPRMSSPPPKSSEEESYEQKRKKIRLNSFSKLDALVQIAEFMYQTETKIADISISNITSNKMDTDDFSFDYINKNSSSSEGNEGSLYLFNNERSIRLNKFESSEKADRSKFV